MLAYSADGTTVLVGDPQGGANGTGAATVYASTGTGWSPGTVLAPPAGAVDFGASVALSANGATALVGDPSSSSVGTETGGSATVYTLDGTWSAGTPLVAPDTSIAFGTSVAVSAAGTVAVVGDPQGGVAGTGAVTVFTDTTAWSSGTPSTPPAGTAAFGTSVAISGGGTTVLVGDPGATGGGSATAYTLDGTWSPGTPLVAPEMSVAFGTSVALSAAGTVAVVGDPPGGGAGTGAVTVFTDTTSWSPGTPLAPPAGAAAFGTSVAISGDGTTVLAGDPGATGGGSATLYTFDGTWSAGAVFALPFGAAAFGTSVAISGDGATAFVGDPGSGSGGAAGAFVIKAPTTTTVLTSPASSNLGAPVSYSATVISAAGTPTGTVTFSVGSTPLCTTGSLTSGTASCSASDAPAGTDTVTGTYSGDADFAPSSARASEAVAAGFDLVGSDGGVFVFGDAEFFYSLPGLGIHVDDIVGIVPTGDDRGYSLVGSDGGVFAFGDARFESSLPGLGIHVHNIVGIVPTRRRPGVLPGRIRRRGVRLRRRPVRGLAAGPRHPRRRHRGHRADGRRPRLLAGQPRPGRSTPWGTPLLRQPRR